MSVRCEINTNRSTDKRGKCGRSDFCLTKLNPNCGMTLRAKYLVADLRRTREERLKLEKELVANV